MTSGNDAEAQPEGTGDSAQDSTVVPGSRPLRPGDVRPVPVRQYPPPTAITVLDRTQRPQPGMTLAPPPPGITVAVDARTAYRIAQRRGGHPHDHGPTITLAQATTDNPCRTDSAGNMTRLIEDRLVHVLRWDDITWWPSGPPLPPGHPPRGPVHGTQWIFVDAFTGEVVLHRLDGTSR